MQLTQIPSPKAQDHYPYVTRRLLHLFSEGQLTNVEGVDVEPDFGYVTRINYKNGSHRVTSGNDLGLNTGAAADLSKDKGYTKFMLRKIGIKCAEGGVFLLPSWAERIRSSPRQGSNTHMRTTDEADSYIESHFGYPAYIKPIDGSKGANVFKIYDEPGLGQALAVYEESKVRVAIIEKPIQMPDYRIVVLDGELISAYLRIPLTVTGDGKHTIAQLVSHQQTRYIAEGRDTRISADDSLIASHLESLNLTLGSRPGAGEQVVLVPVSNLSTGGTSVDVTSTISPRWVELAAYVAESFNLRLCGLDLACDDINDAGCSYCVIEVNAAPGLDHYAMAGEAQQKIVDGLYTKVFNAA